MLLPRFSLTLRLHTLWLRARWPGGRQVLHGRHLFVVVMVGNETRKGIDTMTICVSGINRRQKQVGDDQPATEGKYGLITYKKRSNQFTDLKSHLKKGHSILT